jgi:hypothetical protein
MKISRLLVATLFVSQTALYAEDDGYTYKLYAAGGFSLAHGHAHDMTQKTWGGAGAFNGEFGIMFRHPQATKVAIRPNFGVAKILGDKPSEEQPKIYDLMGIYVGCDIVYSPLKGLPVSISTGPSMHVWNVDDVGTLGNPSQGEKGMKLGWRIGLQYEFNSRWRMELTYTLTEWRTIYYDIENPISTQLNPGFNPSRPAYFCVRASYSF